MIRRFDITWGIYSILLLIQAYHSLKAWFFWWLPDFPATLFFISISLLFLVCVPRFWNFKDRRRTIIAAIIILLFLFKGDGNIVVYLLSMFSSLPLVSLVLLKSDYQIDIFEKFQKTITVVLSVSLFFWILHLVGYDLPSFDVSYGETERNGRMEDQYYFSNHFAYLVSQTFLLEGGIVPDFVRFSSVFLEPGYLAILMVFLIFINEFNIKNFRNILFFLVLLFTISLAGYLLIVFALVVHLVKNSRYGLISLTILGMLVFCGFIFFKNYNNGNNFFNQLIIERLEYDDSEGTIAGNNRTSDAMDRDYERFIRTPDLLFGLGNRADLEFGVGYKAYIMRCGLFGLFLFLLYMFMIARMGRNYRAYFLFVLYVLMFIRGDVTMFWHSFMLVYIGGVVLSKKELLTNEKNRNRITLQRV